MFEKLIALRGRVNSGKTTTFNLLFEKMKGNPKKFELLDSQLVDNGNDFIAIIKDTQNDKKIGLSSSGDLPGKISIFLEKLKEKECNIVVTACHTRGEICNVVRSFSEKTIFVEKTTNGHEFNEKRCNDLDVDFILCEIMLAIEEK